MPDQTTISNREALSRARARAAAELAAQGKYRCGFCKAVKSLTEGIVTTWGGNVLFALCPECHPNRPIVMEQRLDSRGRNGVFVGFLRNSDIPPDVVPVSSLSQLNQYVPKEALAKYKKTDDPFGNRE